MLRFAGILTGSGLAIALIVATMGAPRITVAPTAADESPVREPAAERPALVAETTATNPARAGAAPAAPQPQPQPQPMGPEPPVAEQAQAEPLPSIAAAATGPVPPPEEYPPQGEPENWYAFWSPFRSEIAADGFIARLQQTTGLDYRVVRLEPGVYEVAFAYSDDSDRAEKLQRISAATGLDLSGG